MRQSPDFASPGNTPQHQGEGTKFAAGGRAELGRIVELEFAFVEVGPDHPEFPTVDADTRAAAFTADAVNAAARTVSGFTRAVTGVVNDGARRRRGERAGAVVNGGCYGRRVSGRGTSAPLVAINQAASLVNRTDATVLAATTASVDATRNVALANANVAGLAVAFGGGQTFANSTLRRVSVLADFEICN